MRKLRREINLLIFLSFVCLPSIFAENVQPCERVQVFPSGVVEKNAELSKFSQNILQLFQQRKFAELKSLFHPRFKMKERKVEQFVIGLEEMGGKPLSWSAIESFKLRSADGSSKEIGCQSPRDLPLRISPLYGYKEQISLWLQSLGPKNIFRVHLILVPEKQGFRIGALEFYQWTLGGKSLNEAIASADKNAREKNPEAAYLKLDLLQKILRKTGHTEFPDRHALLDLQTQIGGPSWWLTQIQKILKDEKIQWVSTMFMPEGVGLLIRKRTDKEISLSDLRHECQEKLKTLSLQNSALYAALDGIRCGYNLPKEKIENEGVLGSYFAKKS